MNIARASLVVLRNSPAKPLLNCAAHARSAPWRPQRTEPGDRASSGAWRASNARLAAPRLTCPQLNRRWLFQNPIEKAKGSSMSESDSSKVAETARILDWEKKAMSGVTDPYLREQLEKRREELKTTISVLPAEEASAAATPLVDLLHEVDNAVQ